MKNPHIFIKTTQCILMCILGTILSIKVYAQDSKLTIKKPNFNAINYNDNELKVRAYLIKKYNPGECHEPPHIKYPFETDLIINKDLIKKIKRNYNIKEDSEAEQFALKMSKIGVRLEFKNKYLFYVKDCGSSGITIYKGNIQLRKNKIIETVIEKINEEYVPTPS